MVLVMFAILQNPVFADETKAREWLEARIWATGRICPHCGVVDQSTLMNGKSHRPGLYQCNECREQFTVTVGTVFERSKIPLTKWLAALFLMVCSKRGVSGYRVHRMLGVSYKSTWFMMHRLREAMRSGDLAPTGGEGSIVEVDETFQGRKEGVEKAKAGFGHKTAVLLLVERGGADRSFRVDSAKKEDVIPIAKANIAKESQVITDESVAYAKLGANFAEHDTVGHSPGEYVCTGRKNGVKVNTDTIEDYYSIFKRGTQGVHQHCKEKQLHRDVAEFEFRYSNRIWLGIDDNARPDKLAVGAVGKRLPYRRPNEVPT